MSTVSVPPQPPPRFSLRARLLLVFAVLLVSRAAPAAELPIRLGATVSLSGKYHEPSLMIRDAYQLWAEQVNQGGGLLGRPVELVLRDDESDPDRARPLYAQLLDEDKVDLVLSPYGSPLTLAASEVTEERGYVMLACASASEQVWARGHRYLFGMYATAKRYFIGFLDLMARRGMRSVAVIYESGVFHADVADGVEEWALRFRLTVARYKVESGKADLEATVAALRNQQPPPDGVIISAYPELGHALFEAFGRDGSRPRLLGMTIAPTHPEFGRRYGPLAEGVFAPSHWEPDERIPFPGSREFVRRFQSVTGNLPSYHAGSAYAACQVLEAAVRHAGSLDQKALRDYIATLDTVTVIGRFKVDARGMQIGHNPILIQWQDGNKEIVYPTKMQTAVPRM